MTKILYIGNSFTARNNLPELIAALAREKGYEVEHRLISAGGAALRLHWNAGEALKAIQEGGYDYVVLQEQSTLPIKNAVRFHENVRLFDEVIKTAGAKTVLYLTWARQHAPETQAALTQAYLSIGKEIDAVVVPVGVVWEKFFAKYQEPVLHDTDGSHPSLAGSYLAACVFVATLFKENPADCSHPPGISREHAILLQKAAWVGRGKLE
jgi:hypothetical protein